MLFSTHRSTSVSGDLTIELALFWLLTGKTCNTSPPPPPPKKNQRTLYGMLSFWRPCTSFCSRTKVFCSLAYLDLTLGLVICILFLSNICLLSSLVSWSYLDIQFSNEVCEWFHVPLHSILYYCVSPFYFILLCNSVHMYMYN